MVVIERVCSIVEDVSVDLTDGDQGLQRMPERVLIGNH